MERVLGRNLDRKEKVDHINGNGLDNRRENLRVCSHAENMRNQNSRKNTSSQYKGVSFVKGKYEAKIMINYKTIHLGKYDNELDAVKAYNNKAIELFGEFAKINKL